MPRFVPSYYFITSSSLLKVLSALGGTVPVETLQHNEQGFKGNPNDPYSSEFSDV